MYQKKILTVALATAFLGMSATPAMAAFNVYRNNGLSLDISGQVTAEYKKETESVTWEYPKRGWEDYSVKNKTYYRPLVSGYERRLSDERARIGVDRGASWLQFRAVQELDKQWSARGEMNLGFYRGGDSWTNDTIYLQAANVALDREGWGSLALGKQWLPTNYVARTGTFYPLKNMGTSSLRLDYTGIPDLTVSAYRIFPSQSDVRGKSDLEINGWGAAAIYKLRLPHEQSLRFAAGYSLNKYNHDEKQVTSIKENKAALASVEYAFRNIKLAADYGRNHLEHQNKRLAKTKTDNWGVKAEYAFSPRLRTIAGYGQQESKKTGSTAYSFDDYFTWNAVPVQKDSTGKYLNYISDLEEQNLFYKVKQKRYYLQAEFDWRPNVTLYARADWLQTNNYTELTKFSKRKYREMSAGVSFTF